VNDGSILICYDGSPDAARAIEAAATLLGARSAVVLDVTLPITAAESVATISPVVPGAAFEEMNTVEAGKVAARGAELARSSGFDAEARAALGAQTWKTVVDVADELDAAIIVIGSRGLKGAREALVGSLSHEVIEHAGRPVLIVPPPHDER
jgi:nucleotide-binding universal stress UspA family protein